MVCSFAIGQSAQSDEPGLVTEELVASIDRSENEPVEISSYYSPTFGYLVFTFKNCEVKNVNLSISNNRGQQVALTSERFTYYDERLSVYLGDLPGGTYYANLNLNGEEYTAELSKE